MTTGTDIKRLHAIVEGNVQGVGFRGFVMERAHLQGLTGWVRNCWNGNVEVLAEGPQGILEQFIDDLRRGPHLSNVTNVQIEWGEPTNKFSTFL